MNKFNTIITAALFAVLSFAPASHAMASVTETAAMGESLPTGNANTAAEARIREIYAKDVSTLNKAEKRELRNEVKAIKQRLNGPGTGVYISASALILILILLIILV